ncbi:MAG: repressor LexA [Candidatus Omnitrophica bacterium]|nr:repressor LexA [Candidatus Omnitrophota bacterium]
MNHLTISDKETQALREIRSSIINCGRCPSLRDLMDALGYHSPRSAALVVNKLISKGILRRSRSGPLQLVRDLNDKGNVQTVDVPLVGTASCGLPIFAEENIQAKFPVSLQLARPPHKYFLVRAKGDSMNEKGINHGDFVLVRRQPGAQHNDSVVALVDNEVTIKEYSASKDAVVLKPRSRNKKHKPIMVTRDFQVQGVVVATIPDFEG